MVYMGLVLSDLRGVQYPYPQTDMYQPEPGQRRGQLYWCFHANTDLQRTGLSTELVHTSSNV